MIGRLCTSEGWHKTKLTLTRGGFRILAALALALTSAGANPSGSAQAAPISNVDLQFFITVIPSADYVCVNESMTFKVKVWAVPIDAPLIGPDEPGYDPDNEIFDLTNVDVHGEALDMSIGVIEPGSLRIGSQSAHKFSAQFTFTAFGKPGETQVFFDSTIPRNRAGGIRTPGEGQTIYVYNDNTRVEVRNCSYKVEMLFQDYQTSALTGTAKEVSLNRVSDTHFSGTTYFNLTYNFKPGEGCPITSQISPVKVDYSADLAGEKLDLTVNYGSMKVTITATTCGDLPQTGSQSVETPPVSFTLSVPSKGGVGVLSSPYWRYLFIVTRESQ
jgi:hypothetical protein